MKYCPDLILYKIFYKLICYSDNFAFYLKTTKISKPLCPTSGVNMQSKHNFSSPWKQRSSMKKELFWLKLKQHPVHELWFFAFILTQKK